MFRYTLWFLGRQTESPKIMGLDEVFVHLVMNYYMKGDAYWLHDTDISKYYDAAMKIASNIIGKPAPALDMQDSTGKPFRLADVKSKYTLLVFWDPTCGHCRTEVPQVDSAYKAELKSKGVKIVGIRTEGGTDKWQEFIKEKKLYDWTHIYDPAHKSNYRAAYNVYTTPVIYLLDENKKILGKRLDHSNIGGVIEMIEKQQASGKLPGGKGVGMK
jgi:peroxiredoxin